MLAHSHQFDEKHMRDIGGKRAGLPLPINSSKVTRGASDDPRYHLSPELEDMLENIWQEQIASQFGFETYEDLRQSLRDLHQSNDATME